MKTKCTLLIYNTTIGYIGFKYIGEGRVLWPMFLLLYKKENISY